MQHKHCHILTWRKYVAYVFKDHYTKHFIQYADPSDEPTAPFYDQTFEDYDLTVDVWKGKLNNICNFKCIIQNLFSEKVWNTIKAFREEMFGERFMN